MDDPDYPMFPCPDVLRRFHPEVQPSDPLPDDFGEPDEDDDDWDEYEMRKAA